MAGPTTGPPPNKACAPHAVSFLRGCRGAAFSRQSGAPPPPRAWPGARVPRVGVGRVHPDTWVPYGGRGPGAQGPGVSQHTHTPRPPLGPSAPQSPRTDGRTDEPGPTAMAGALLALLLLLASADGSPTAAVPTTPPTLPPDPPRCDPALAPIEGGWGELVAGGEGLRYRCPQGSTPFPTGLRRCSPEGVWDPLPEGSSPRCQAVWCPAPLEFEQGWFWPRRGRHPLGSRLEFGCFGGFALRGPHTLRCGPGGRWEGATPVCDDGAGACPAPGVPPGATKEGSDYGVEGRVRYRCRPGLELLGSAERRCLEGGVWSGTEPRCRDPHFFDTPEDVATSFLASLAQIVEVAEANGTQGPTEKRRIRLSPGAAMNIYLVLDASQSVGPRDFEDARNALRELVEKIASYGAAPHYGIITFGTEARVVLSPMEPQAADGAWVAELLEKLPFA
ncbi:complement factor B-like protease, partial [Mycteria americana]